MKEKAVRLLLENRLARFILSHKKIFIPLFLFALIGGYFLYPKAPKSIETQTIKRGHIVQAVTASGTVASTSSVNLSFTTSGKLVFLGAKKGDRVEKGQTIATLDTRSAQKSYENALRDYAKQRNSFDQTKSDEGVNDIKDVQNDSVKRVLENNQYDLEKAVASVELSEIAKQATILTSPITGILTRSDVTVAGVNISPSSIFTVSDVENLIFQVEVDEADIGKVHLGQLMKISFDAYPDDTVTATITSMDFASHTTSTGGTAFTVEAELPITSDDRFRIGMNADAEIVIVEKKNALTIPISALIDETHVYIKGKNGFEKRKISPGIQSDIDIEVKNGLKEGEVVAVLPDDVEKNYPNLKK